LRRGRRHRQHRDFALPAAAFLPRWETAKPHPAMRPVLTVDGVTLANGVCLSCTQHGPKSGDLSRDAFFRPSKFCMPRADPVISLEIPQSNVILL
jgi:hypothetical protein